MIARSVVLVCVLASSAAADDWKDQRGFIEWSSWITVGAGVEHVPESTIARREPGSTTLPRYDQRGIVVGALGADATLGVPTPNIRVGGWIELRAGLEIFSGVELLVAGSPRELPWFQYSGEGVWSLRAGASETHATGSIAWGYRCPWTMYSAAPRGTRYMIGGRLVATAARAFDDPTDWSMSLGIELEPVGFVRYVMAIQSWY